MFCTNCGAKNEEGVKFCTSCGKLLAGSDGNPGINDVTSQQGAGKPTGSGTAAAAATTKPASAAATTKPAAATATKPAGSQRANKPKGFTPVIIGGCAAFVALIVIIFVVQNVKPTIDLDD